MSSGDEQLRSLLVRGRDARLAGDLDTAATLLTAARQRARQVGDQRGELVALLQVGSMWVEAGESGQALEVLTDAAVLAQSLKEQLGEADAFIGIGRAQFLLDAPGAARTALETALELYRSLRHAVGEARAELYLGRVSSGDEAFTHLDRAAALFEGAGERRGQAEALLTLGKKSLEEGSLISADGSLREAAALFDELGDQASVAETEEAIERVKTWPN